MILERWKEIPGWSGLYEASTEGRIRSTTTRGRWPSHVLAQHPNIWGYYLVGLCENFRHRGMFTVHLLIAQTFIGPIPDGLEVDHVDRDKANNRPSNLEFVTSKTNSIRAGVVLTEQQYYGILERWIAGETRQGIGKVMGINRSIVTQVVAGRREHDWY